MKPIKIKVRQKDLELPDIIETYVKRIARIMSYGGGFAPNSDHGEDYWRIGTSNDYWLFFNRDQCQLELSCRCVRSERWQALQIVLPWLLGLDHLQLQKEDKK